MLVVEGEVTSPWGPERPQQIRAADLEPVLRARPEILLLGTGRTTVFPDVAVIEALRECGIGLECMGSEAAARTYNILIGEGRRTAAALFAPSLYA